MDATGKVPIKYAKVTRVLGRTGTFLSAGWLVTTLPQSPSRHVHIGEKKTEAEWRNKAGKCVVGANIMSHRRFPWRCHPGPRRVHGWYVPKHHPKCQGTRYAASFLLSIIFLCIPSYRSVPSWFAHFRPGTFFRTRHHLQQSNGKKTSNSMPTQSQLWHGGRDYQAVKQNDINSWPVDLSACIIVKVDDILCLLESEREARRLR